MEVLLSRYFWGFIILLLLSIIGILWWKIYSQRAKLLEVERRYAVLEKRFDGMHLKSLESKLQPHLFKNILNSVQSHAYQTYYTLDKLANVLDYILYEGRDDYVSIRSEIDFSKSLIDINKIKVSPLFDIKVKTKVATASEYYEQKLISPMLCLDFIENAFKHADLQSSEAYISFYFELADDGIFSFTVSNTSSGQQPLFKQKGGIGIEAFEQRLQILYKNCFKLERFTENNTFTAHLTLDLKELERTKMHIAR